jgi:uncharacterized membrane protein
METSRIRILVLYFMFALAVVLGMFPDMTLQNISFLTYSVVLVFAYIFRRGRKEDDFESHHCTYLIRSIWIFSFLAVIAIVGAGYMVGQQADASALDGLLGRIESAGQMPSEADLDAAFKVYYTVNQDLIFQLYRLWMCPALAYGAWRIVRGVSRAAKGYRVAHPKSWN